MILMALDHVRDYFGAAGNPTDPARASVALFFTRWITHLCAPTFFLLTGTAAYLARRRRTTGELSRFLVARGAWLILLELTLVRCLGYQFNVDYHVTMLIILWALGWAMIVLGVLVYLPRPAIATFGIALVVPQPVRSGEGGVPGDVRAALDACCISLESSSPLRRTWCLRRIRWCRGSA